MSSLLRRCIRLLAIGTWTAFAGCSLLVDTSDIDAPCLDGQKLCRGRCVDNEDPSYGCRKDTCDACAVENAIPICAGEACAPGECLAGFDCKTCFAHLLTDAKNCGACGESCRETQLCSEGRCVERSSF